jgi:hypothetical protein
MEYAKWIVSNYPNHLDILDGKRGGFHLLASDLGFELCYLRYRTFDNNGKELGSELNIKNENEVCHSHDSCIETRILFSGENRLTIFPKIGPKQNYYEVVLKVDSEGAKVISLKNSSGQIGAVALINQPSCVHRPDFVAPGTKIITLKYPNEKSPKVGWSSKTVYDHLGN